MKTFMMIVAFLAGLCLLAGSAHPEVVTGKVIQVERAFNTIHILRKAPDGQEAPAKVVWDDYFRQDQELENTEVGYMLTVDADRDFFGNWQVKEVLPDPIYI